MATCIGIDLGTTNSVAAFRRAGTVQFVESDQGQVLVPSAVSYTPEGIVVGRPALMRALVNPNSTVVDSKRLMGDTEAGWDIDGRRVTPTDVATEILSYLKRCAERQIGTAVDRAVITVPAYFTSVQKAATREAGERAGFKVERLIPEPTAAAISYGWDRSRDQTVLVYDFGGGTFDVSIVRVQSPEFEVLAVHGDSRLGGRDVDEAILQWLLEKVSRPGNVKQRTASGAQQLLLEAARKAKIELTESSEADILIPDILGQSLDATLSREKLDELVQPLIERTRQSIETALREAKLGIDDVDRIVLAGGSSKLQAVRRMLSDRYREPWSADRLDLVVASGAAIVADAFDAPMRLDLPQIVDVTPHDLGVLLRGGAFHVLVRRNTPLPATAVYDGFSTVRTNQTAVDVHVFQGESAVAAENVFIGGFRLEGIPPAKAGEPKIEVRFTMDQSDLLSVSAASGTQQASRTLDVTLRSVIEERRVVPGVDFVFLIDTSGSMSKELSGIKSRCGEFAREVEKGGTDCRLGLVDFDKPSGRVPYKVEVFPPMPPGQFPGAIAGLRIGRLGGAGCYVGDPASVAVFEQLVAAFDAPERLKIAVLVSDEVGNDAKSIPRIISTLTNAGVTLHVVGVAGSCHERIARETEGRFWNINDTRSVDFGELLSSIASEVTDMTLRHSD